MWLRRSAWVHWALVGYLWLIAWIPLGDWNRQGDENLLPALLEGKGIGLDDIILLALVTVPAILYWVAYKGRKFWFGVAALITDLAWLGMQIQSWWLPYILGTDKAWQLRYAKGPTTKVLPSFGNHVAPDGMHLAISVLLVAALITGFCGIRQVRRARANA